MIDDGNKVRFRFYVERGQRIAFRDDPPPPRPKPPPRGCIPRISRLVALAHRFDGLLRDGTVATMADIARLGHVTRARVTQIMDLLLLAPDIQEDLLHLPLAEHRDPVTLRGLRHVLQTPVWAEQRKRWAGIRAAIRSDDVCPEDSVLAAVQPRCAHRRHGCDRPRPTECTDRTAVSPLLDPLENADNIFAVPCGQQGGSTQGRMPAGLGGPKSVHASPSAPTSPVAPTGRGAGRRGARHSERVGELAAAWLGRARRKSLPARRMQPTAVALTPARSR